MIINITEEQNGMTVRDYLFGVLRLSVAAVKRVKYREGGITVNGEYVTVRKVLSEGDVLYLAMEDREEDENKYTVPVEISVKIAYEDEYLTVVDKPSNMPSHPSLGHKDDTVANALAWRYRDKPYVFRPVNRLDRDTSGLMLTARGKIPAGRLYRSMVSNKIEKAYLAVVKGRLEGEGTVETYMCREGDSIVKRCVCDESHKGAKLAITEYKALFSDDGYSIVKACPVTGRTHQLRVHFASVGHPIIGDTMYGEESPYIDRHALHAYYLAFPHPQTEEALELFSPLPADIKKLIKKLNE